MQKSAKYALIACVVVLLAGGAAFWWFVLRDDAPERASLPVRTETDATSTSGPPGSSASPDGDWVVVTGDDVFVGYRIQELFGGETIKKTAVGRTPAVTGTLVISDGAVTSVDITADVTLLESDSSRRDSFIRDDALETGTFTTATFTITEPIALPADLPVDQAIEVTVAGDLTLHGVTQPVELTLEASWNGSSISVAGGAPIVLADYGIEPPDIPFVAVDDAGEFEMQLVFERA
jgi:polyisoprenoid-binding protein YceI